MNATSTPLVTTSWDDGHPADLRLADLLEKYTLPATFYVPRRCSQSVMNEDEIRQLSRRFEIGAHTLDHVYLCGVSDIEAAAQIRDSKQWIEDVTGEPCGVFCFPGGQYGPRHINMVRAAGFRAARTVEFLATRRPRAAAQLALLPTTVQVFPHRFPAYLRNAARHLSFFQLLGSGVLHCSGDWTALAQRLLSRVLRAGGVFHLWGHSWEIERLQQWRQLEAFFAELARCRDSLQFLANGPLADDPLEIPGTR
jgi:peptidoglycan-N-acetylglucosamine deacetylase